MHWETMTPRARGDVVIVDLVGKTFLSGEEELPALVANLLGEGYRKFVLNLRDLPFIDSPGLGSLVLACTSVSQAGGRLVLAHPHERIRNVCVMTHLTAVLELFETEALALEALAGPVSPRSRSRVQD